MSLPVPLWRSRKVHANVAAAGDRSVSHISMVSLSIAKATSLPAWPAACQA
jgi:hypothetical protein